jgi:hypothetical protein
MLSRCAKSGTKIAIIMDIDKSRLIILLISVIVAGLCSAMDSSTGTTPGIVHEVRGEVADSLTEELLPLVNIYVEGAAGGCLTDEEGAFRFKSRAPIKKLRVSSMGYKTLEIAVNPDSAMNMKIFLLPSAKTLKEVYVKRRKEKYSRKNNPAVELMENIRAASKRHNPQDSSWYSYDKYEKMTIGLSDFEIPDSGSWSDRKIPFIREYIDTVAHADRPILKVSVREKTATHLFRKGDTKGKEIVTGIKTAGIDKSFNQSNIQNALEDTFREIDIFGNDITVLQNRFVSPLSAIGANYYKYYLDTVTDGGIRCLELSFVPHNPESMGFNGKMWVALGDTTFFVRKIAMRTGKAVNLNFVKNLFISQAFRQDQNGNRHTDMDDITVELHVIPGTQGLYARRQTAYTGHSFSPDKSVTAFCENAGTRFLIKGAEERDNDYWEAHRLIEMPRSEKEMGSLLQKLRSVPLIYWSEKILSVIVNGYIKTGKKSRFDLGPINTLVSTNKAEGVRFRIGGMTTANLSPHLFARGYVAYGLRDKKWKYRAELDYSFSPKEYHSREFPMNSIRAEYQYDTDRIGEHYLFTNPDNIFLSVKRKGSFLITYRRRAEIKYVREYANNLSFEAGLRQERQEATQWVKFQRADGSFDPHFNQTSLFVSLRYAPGEKFVQGATSRRPVNMDAPVFLLTHEYGPKRLLGADFSINKTEFSFQKRFWFSAFGYLDTNIKLGKIWSAVYYPALAWQNANLSYTIQPESYALLNPMEFALDQYASVDLTYFGNGILFNRIPLVKKLKMREVLTFKGFMGHLSKKNNPDCNKDLYRFPADANVGLMDATPYMEAGVGIDNIASILRIDYIWRLTYLDRPYIDRSGLRISLHFSF